MFQVYTRLIGGRLSRLAFHSSGNFVVQRLLDHCRTADQLEAYWAELDGRLEDVLGAGCTGVILALARAARRLNSCQAQVSSEEIGSN